ncbi:unnamed protein product [marine sediment metagenome]|uniref:Uncharacterized protein n=1 Tax=marine sediment metagenome TaxID=412755 RepID=X1A2G3_9ZZZZ
MVKIMDIMESSRKSQEAQAIPNPINIINPDMYIGCLEKRYSPLVAGLPPGGLVARFTQTMVYRAVPTRAMGRPI